MNRRNFMLSSAVGIGGMVSLGNISFATNFTEKNKDKNAVIFLFLAGGASHIETFNPIPNAPADRRSVTGHTDTNVPGIKLGGLFTELAKRTDKVSIFRGFHHRDANHASATHWVVTGEANFGAGTTQKWPSLGSVASARHGTNTENGLPTYIKVNSIQHDDAAWMGGKYIGYDATREGRRDLQLSMQEQRFRQRMHVLNMMDSNFHEDNLLAKQWSDLRTQAVNVLVGEASRAFRIENDPAYATFSENNFSKDVLTSVRLVEAGAKFVTISYGGWDMHSNINDSLNRRQPMLDKYVSLLMDMLEARGLNESTMLVVTSEFGRTPKVNQNAGRDHWARLAPLLISCDGYDMGRVVGASDGNAEEARDGLCTPEDLRWTIFNHLDIPKNMTWTSIDGRPMHLVKDEAKNILSEL